MMLRRALGAAMVLCAAITLPSGNRIAWGQEHRLEVFRHPNVPLADSDARAILNEAGVIARGIDDPQDYSCNLSFALGGSIKIVSGVSAFPSVIATQSDLTNALAGQGRITIVERITFCQGRFQTALAGCTSPKTQTMIVARQPANVPLEAVAFLHEFGHVQGLGHRRGENLNALMNGTLYLRSRNLNKSECECFIRRFPRPPGGAVCVAGSAP